MVIGWLKDGIRGEDGGPIRIYGHTREVLLTMYCVIMIVNIIFVVHAYLIIYSHTQLTLSLMELVKMT